MGHEDGNADSGSIRLAITTVASRSDAERLGTVLIERQLAACVNIGGPIHSIYRWQGVIERADEYILLIKTDLAHLDPLQSAIHDLHSYRTPEFLVLEVASGSDAYARWLLDCLTQ